MRKKYNTPHRSRVVKTRLSEDEYADFINLSDYGVHFNKELDMLLKQKGQEAFERNHTRAEFRKIFGRNYL